MQLGVTWSATGGTVDAAGMFTADTIAGDYYIIASNLTGTVADTAQVLVVSPTVAPVPRLLDTRCCRPILGSSSPRPASRSPAAPANSIAPTPYAWR